VPFGSHSPAEAAPQVVHDPLVGSAAARLKFGDALTQRYHLALERVETIEHELRINIDGSRHGIPNPTHHRIASRQPIRGRRWRCIATSQRH
jgi:hypothetical protein